MNRVKVILVHDGSRESGESLNPDTLPECIEVVGSLTIEGLSTVRDLRNGRKPILGGTNLHLGVSESITGVVQRNSNQEVSGRVFPLSVPEAIEDRPVSLTRTELEVLRLLAKGQQNKEIANEMFISVNTVKSHVSSILRKLRVRNRAQAVRYVYKCGMWQ